MSAVKIGMNLRAEWLDDVIEHKPDIAFFEIIAENWFTDGPHQKKLEIIRQDYPILLHCVGMNLGGEEAINPKYLNKVKTIADRFQVEQISDHLCMQAHKGIHFHDLLPFPMTHKDVEYIANNINIAQNHLNTGILIENLTRYIRLEENEMNEAEFITLLVEKTGCGLLLDLCNIWINEQNYQHDRYSFLGSIPITAVKEIHIAGPQKNQNGNWVDTHAEPPNDEILMDLGFLAQSFPDSKQPRVIYERDNNRPSLFEMMDINKESEKRLENLERINNKELNPPINLPNKKNSSLNSRDFLTSSIVSTTNLPLKLATEPRHIPEKDSWGIRVYRNNHFYGLIDILEECFVATKITLGENNFKYFASQYAQLNPSKEWDLDQYGHHFPAFINEPDQLSKHESPELKWYATLDYALYNGYTLIDESKKISLHLPAGIVENWLSAKEGESEVRNIDFSDAPTLYEMKLTHQYPAQWAFEIK